MLFWVIASKRERYLSCKPARANVLAHKISLLLLVVHVMTDECFWSI